MAAPARLPETTAMALLDAWLTAEETYEPMPPQPGQLVHERVEVQFLCSDDDVDETFQDALAVRRALEAMNALACCRGFGVEENPMFWRRVFVGRIDDPDSNCSSSPYHAFAPGMLSRYRVVAFATEPIEATAAAIVGCCSMDPESAAMDARRQVHAQLAPFLVRAPPTLELHLDPFSSGILESTNAIAHVRRCLEETDRMWSWLAPPTSSFQERVAIVCDTYADADSLAHVSEIAQLPCVELCKVHIVIRERPSRTLASATSALLRALIQVDRTATMEWVFRSSHRSCFEAIFSAIPAMQSLKEFCVTSRDLETNEADASTIRSYYAWLAYALHSGKTDVSVSAQLIEGSAAVLSSTWATPHGLLHGVAFPRGWNASIHPYGTSATLHAGATLASTIGRRSQLREESVSFSAATVQPVNVIATYNTNAVVVWPGIGLMSTDMGSLCELNIGAITPRDPRTSNVHGYCTQDFTFTQSDCAAVADFVSYAGSTLHRISLDKIREEDADAFTRILQACSRLDTLRVGAMGCIDPLLEAYEDGHCAVTTLAIGKMTVDSLHTVIRALQDPTTCMSRIIQRLQVDHSSIQSEGMQEAANLLIANRRMQYLRLDEVWDDDAIAVGDRYFCALLDCPLMQTTASKQAAYTFLLAARRTRVLRAIPMPIAETIVAFAATPVLRHVSWRETP